MAKPWTNKMLSETSKISLWKVFRNPNIASFQRKEKKHASENKMWQLESEISKPGEALAKMAWKCTLQWNPFHSQFWFDLIMSGSFQAVFSRNSLEKTKPVYIKGWSRKMASGVAMNYRAVCQEKKAPSAPSLLWFTNRSSAACETRRSGFVIRHAACCRYGRTSKMVKRGVESTFLWVTSEGRGTVYYGLLPYCKTIMWLAVDMSAETDGDTASLWHQIASRTCCRVINGRSGRPRHVISTCKHPQFLQFSFSVVSQRLNFTGEQAKWWCAHGSTVMHRC